jgi:hypothetical protein
MIQVPAHEGYNQVQDETSLDLLLEQPQCHLQTHHLNMRLWLVLLDYYNHGLRRVLWLQVLSRFLLLLLAY